MDAFFLVDDPAGAHPLVAEGMLSPEMKEEITGNAEIRETYKISKVGTIAGCMVTDGKLFRNSKIRIIRDGVVVFSGEFDRTARAVS